MLLGLAVIAQAGGTPAHPASAVELSPRVYLTGGVVMTVQPASHDMYHRVRENLRGHAAGLTVGVGTFLTRSLALEGEVAVGDLISAPQTFSYAWTIDYVAENRDILFNELLRWSPGERRRFQAVVGGGYARTISRKVSQIRRDFLYGGAVTPLPDESTPLSGFTATGGIDWLIPVRRRLALAPTFRLRWVHRPDAAAVGWNGVGSYAFQFGLTARMR
jgi:hypothetical protein